MAIKTSLTVALRGRLGPTRDLSSAKLGPGTDGPHRVPLRERTKVRGQLFSTVRNKSECGTSSNSRIAEKKHNRTGFYGLADGGRLTAAARFRQARRQRACIAQVTRALQAICGLPWTESINEAARLLQTRRVLTRPASDQSYEDLQVARPER